MVTMKTKLSELEERNEQFEEDMKVKDSKINDLSCKIADQEASGVDKVSRLERDFDELKSVLQACR